MKPFLVISQMLYGLCLFPWLMVWGLSFMGFDTGFSWFAVAWVTGIGMYPVAAVVCAVAAWILHTRRRLLALALNLIPALWIIGLWIVLSSNP